jgi:hypothetical protein
VTDTRYIAMVPQSKPCPNCNGTGETAGDGSQIPDDFGSEEVLADFAAVEGLADCAECRGIGRVPTIDLRPVATNHGEKLYGTPGAARKVARARLDAMRGLERSNAQVRAVNLDDLERVDPPESDEERFQRCERIMLAAAAEVERMRASVESNGQVQAKPPTLAVSHVELVTIERSIIVRVKIDGQWLELIREHDNGAELAISHCASITAAKPARGGT